MKNIVIFGVIAGLFLFVQNGSFAQDKALQKQDNKAKAVYIPVKTKEDIAAGIAQKREKEAIELQKKPVLNEVERNDATKYRREAVMEKQVIMKTAPSKDVTIEEKQPVKEEQKLKMYREYDTPVKPEKQIQLKEYKPEEKNKIINAPEE